MMHFSNRSLVSAICVLTVTNLALADGNTLQVDWGTRTAACPPKITQSTQYTVTVTNINDVVIDFNTGERVLYTFRAKGTPVSVAPSSNPFTPNASPSTCPVDATQFQAQLDRIKAAVAANPSLNPPAGTSVPLSVSLAAAANINDVGSVRQELSYTICNPVTDPLTNNPVYQWVKRLDGTHSVNFTVNLEPNQTYTYTLTESWKGKVTNGGTVKWTCGETDILSLSVGPLITTLPSRTYNSQTAPVPAGSSTTQDILVVGNNSNINVLGAALLNYHLPQPSFLPAWTGFTLSAGPVYQLGNTSPSVSALGIFLGGSMHLYRSFYLTPGVHIGQFADFPAGFYPGTVIPSGFGALTPVKRNTAHFAIGITFKTTSFTKSNQNNGAGSTPGGAATPPATQPAGGNQPAGGSTPPTPPKK